MSLVTSPTTFRPSPKAVTVPNAARCSVDSRYANHPAGTVLLKFQKLPEPVIIAGVALTGLAACPLVRH
ncbi:protein of unknown function (plasmid) [Cupriavidus taiwanensis]|uniref:Uncharacterized protein n=1 Tax=Cupriavidus taiwanensis TaxID=164546 RepID=A0A375HL23_9BURK|nr:hypothetical protein CBM2622_B160005 [Cupriavidus taiwanensis]SPD57490.1 protein of unknown function [Cupriavidus taiwanensis]SPK74700.1 protein of unknown function [Cupriavidus taiwanensis]